MSDDRLRRRLEALNRGPLPAISTAAGSATIQRKRQRARTGATSESASPAASAAPLTPPAAVKPTGGLLSRGEVVATPHGEHLRICLAVDEMWPGGTQLVSARHEHLCRHGRSVGSPRAPAAGTFAGELAALVQAFPDGVLLLDLETCGLAGSALFLVGLLRPIDGTLTVELLLARDYAEEAAVLASLWQIAGGSQVLVTFNGKSFDWPMVLDRSTRHRLIGRTARSNQDTQQSNDAARQALSSPSLHVDILHHARRRWRRHLPDCRLQTLERMICRRGRSGDIPGDRIPAAYAHFVRTGDERDLEAILYHNAVDLVTLLDLTMRLCG